MNEESEQSPMTALDQLVSGDSMQLIKAAIPYLPPQAAGFTAMYCKIKELENTILLSRQLSGSSLRAMSSDSTTPDFYTLLNDMKKYVTPQGQQQIESLQQMLDTIQLFHLMQETGNENPEADA